MTEQTITVSILFQALTKRSMILGVDYDYFFIALMMVLLAFIYSNNFLVVLLIVPLHGVGWCLCVYDRHIFKLLSIRASIGTIANLSLWSMQCYQPY